jgi:hypothetical protein
MRTPPSFARRVDFLSAAVTGAGVHDATELPPLMDT